ncbi:MAG: 60S ribosomal export protein NMD3 [Candidatus Altiarchaeota archaeon]|nr:60S ribosomal export protein NMD3 [Candidatus Altiarchaeota archaeon]
MICPNCGKKSEVDMLCKECFLRKKLRLELPNSLGFEYCTRCSSAKMSGKWVEFDQIEDAVAELVTKNAKGNLEEIEEKLGEVLALDLDVIYVGGQEYSATISLEYGNFLLERKTKVIVKKVSCPSCSKKSGGYFEAVLQIRGDFDPQIVEKIEKRIEKSKDQNAFITKITRVRGGIDIYIGSKKVAEKIARSFRTEAEIKKSSQLISVNRQTSKALSRFYYGLRF